MPKLSKIKNVVFLGRKESAPNALKHLLTQGINVKFVVAPEAEQFGSSLRQIAQENKIPIFNNEKVYELIAGHDEITADIDLVISYLFWKKIKEPLYCLGRLGCINLHPAPLPDYKNRAGYNTAILEGQSAFGASAHFINSEDFDSGPIIKVKRFTIDAETETVFSLQQKTQAALLELFIEVIDLFLNSDEIVTSENFGGLNLSGKQLEELKQVNLEKDSLAEINRKVRAFFFPPYHGAKINIKGQDFTLVNEEILTVIHKLINNKQ